MSDALPSPTLPRLLFLVTEDWYFWSHRLPVARAARDAGFEVHVACRVRDHGAAIAGEGFILHPLSWRRGSMNPIGALRAVREIAALYRTVDPRIVHHIALKPAVLGGIAALCVRGPSVLTTLAGRGAMLEGRGPRSALAGVVVRGLLRLLAWRRRGRVIVQNPDDAAWLERFPAVGGVALIPGSGVPLERFTPMAEPAGPFTVAQVSRLIALKGVEDLVRAVERVRAGGHDVRLILAGARDGENPGAVPGPLLDAWRTMPWISLPGHVGDVREVWAEAHVAVLASRGGEGVPMALMEAAACGRPMIATDIAGSREVARPGHNAILVPPGDPDALAGAILGMMDGAFRRELAGNSRGVVDPDLGDRAIGDRTLAIYRALAQPAGRDAG